MSSTGRCLCGAVTFTAQGVHHDVHSCHCGICRRWSGGPAFAASVDDVRFDGEQHIRRFDSSDWAERGFCERCGTHLFYRLKEANQYMLWLGAFDDQAPFRLAGEIFIDEKPASYDLAGDHSRMTGAEFIESMQQSDD